MHLRKSGNPCHFGMRLALRRPFFGGLFLGPRPDRRGFSRVLGELRTLRGCHGPRHYRVIFRRALSSDFRATLPADHETNRTIRSILPPPAADRRPRRSLSWTDPPGARPPAIAREPCEAGSA